MTFVNLCFLLTIASMSVLVFSKYEKDLTAVISSALYIISAIFALSGIEKIINELKKYFARIDSIDLSLLIKIGGMAVVGGIASSLCDSAGQKGLSEIIELVVTVEIMLLLFPIAKEGIESIMHMLGG